MIEAESQIASSEDRQARRRGFKRKALYIALAGTAFLIALSWLVLKASTFKGEVEQAMTALNIYTDTLIQKDYSSAYQITSPKFRSAISYSDFVAYQSNLTATLGRLKSATQSNWDVDSINSAKTATIDVNLQFESGNIPLQFILHKEEGIWRVFSYKEPNGIDVRKN
jgi:hypothetical protein